MSALSFKIDAETDKLNSFIASLERLQSVLEGIPSGTKEFDVLNRKIAEMEARVEQSMKKIAQMQGEADRTVQQAAASSPATSQNTAANAAAADNAAYQDLLETLKAVNASKEENVSLISHYQAQIASLKAQIEALNEEERKGLKLSDQQKTTRFAATVSIEEYKQALSRSRRELANQIKLEQVAVGSIDEMSQALARMRTVYRSLNESERGSNWGQNLLKQIETLDTKIKGLDASMGVHTRNVGNYASGFNGLQFQIQQVARELPSLAYGPQIFFSAISNNLPMLADEFSRAKKQYTDFIKTGQQATPVWKQMLSSIFSWQTALVAGLTVLTVYGKEITEWVGSLFKGKKALDSTKMAAEQFHATMAKGAIDAQGEITKLNLLYRAATDLSKPYKERAEAVKKLQDIYPAYFGNMSAEQVMVGNAVGAYENLRDAIIQVAEAKAAQELITEDEKSLQRIKQTGSAYAKYSLSLKEYKVAYAAVQKVGKKLPSHVIPFTQESKNFENAKANIRRFREEFISALSKLGEEGDDLWKRIDESYEGDVDAFIATINDGIEKLTPAAEKLYTIPTPQELNAEAEKARQEAENAAKQEKDQEDLEKALKKLRDDALQAEIDAMPEGTAKRVAQIELDYSKRAEAIREGEEKLRRLQKGELSTEQQTRITSLHTANDATRKAQKEDLVSASKDAWNEYLLKFGTFKERVLATEEKYNRKIAAAGTEGERAMLLAEKQQALAELEVEGSEWAQQLTDMTLKVLQEKIAEAQQLLNEAQQTYDNLESSDTAEAAKLRDTINRLKAEIALMQNQGNKAKEAIANKDWAKGAEFLNDIASTAREAAGALGELDEALGKIATFIATTASAAGNLITTLTGVQAASSAAGAAMTAMEKASVILAAISAAFQLISAAVSIFTGPSKATKEYEGLKAQYDGLIDVWDQLIDKKREYIKESWGEELENVGEETLALIKKQEEAARLLAQSRLKAGASAGSHSYGYRMWQGSYKFNGQNWKDVAPEIEKALGESIQGMADFTTLSADQLAWIKENYAELWAAMDGDFREYLGNIITYGEETVETTKAIQEQWTGISFEGMNDDFLDLLLDMDSESKDFADNFEKYLQKAILSSLVGTIYKKQLEDLYKDWTEASKDGLDKNEARDFQNRYKDITEKALAEREALAKTFEWNVGSKTPSATSGGFETLSQDTGNELNGRFTDIQGKVTDIRGFVMTQTPQIIALLTSCQHIELIQVETIQVGHELLRYAVMIYMEVTEINSTTKSMLKVLNSMDERLSGIERNTDNL